MLKSGKYIAEHDNGIFDRYRIVMSVKETEKSYIFELLEYVSRYSPAQIVYSGEIVPMFRKNGYHCSGGTILSVRNRIP